MYAYAADKAEDVPAIVEGFYGVTDDVVEVKNGATLSLGNHELHLHRSACVPPG